MAAVHAIHQRQKQRQATAIFVVYYSASCRSEDAANSKPQLRKPLSNRLPDCVLTSQRSAQGWATRRNYSHRYAQLLPFACFALHSQPTSEAAKPFAGSTNRDLHQQIASRHECRHKSPHTAADSTYQSRPSRPLQ